MEITHTCMQTYARARTHTHAHALYLGKENRISPNLFACLHLCLFFCVCIVILIFQFHFRISKTLLHFRMREQVGGPTSCNVTAAICQIIAFFIACLMCWPYHPFFYSISRQISTVLSGVCSVVWWLVRIKTELTITRRTYVLDKGCLFSVDMVVCVCVCDGGCWQWQWKIPPVAAFIVWQFAYVCFREWQNKRSRADFVVAHESLQCFNPTSEASPKTLIATYTTHKR